MKQTCYPPCWGDVGIKKWSLLFCFGNRSAIFWHLKTGTFVGDDGLNDFVDDDRKKDQGVVCHFDGKVMEQDFSKQEPKNCFTFLLNFPLLQMEM